MSGPHDTPSPADPTSPVDPTDLGPEFERRPNRGTAWVRTAVVALVVTALFCLVPVLGGADDIGQVVGFFAGRGVVAYLITALCAVLSRRPWGWPRYVFSYLAITLLLAVIGNAGGS